MEIPVCIEADQYDAIVNLVDTIVSQCEDMKKDTLQSNLLLFCTYNKAKQIKENLNKTNYER